MKQEMAPLCHFRHHIVFYVCNLQEIVSARLINSHANYARPVDKKGYFWGQYKIEVSYRRHQDREDIRQRIISRGFIINYPYSLPELSQEKQHDYTCEVTCLYQAAPVSLMFFPLLNRIHFVPFKVLLDVTGMIRKSTDEWFGSTKGSCQGNREECHCVEKGACNGKEREAKAEKTATPGIIGKEEIKDRDVVDLDLIALEKKNISQAPGAKSTRPQAFNLYYNMLIEHEGNIQKTQPENKAADEKIAKNREQR